MSVTRMPKPKVADPIIFRPTPTSTERVIRPCSGKHREYWLSGYIVASCSKCIATMTELESPDLGTTEGERNG